jgi:hypothetical protein
VAGNKPELSNEEIEKRVASFRKTIRYRKIAGMVLAGVGLVVLAVGLQTKGEIFLKINGGFCLAYGLFMRWQSAKCERKLSPSEPD